MLLMFSLHLLVGFFRTPFALKGSWDAIAKILFKLLYHQLED